MAYVYLRKNGRVEIREAHSTRKGPRSRTLASFQGALTEEHLGRAESAATRRFDRAAIRARARKLGVPILAPSAARSQDRVSVPITIDDVVAVKYIGAPTRRSARGSSPRRALHTTPFST